MGRLKKAVRVGQIDINGEVFPAVINTAILMELEDQGIDIDHALTDDAGRRWHNAVKLIALAINAGCRLTGNNETVTEEEIADSIDMACLRDITPQLGVLMGATGRTVKAEPPKN